MAASELTALRSAAYDHNLSAFPGKIRGMLDAWLGAERALDSLVLRLKASRTT